MGNTANYGETGVSLSVQKPKVGIVNPGKVGFNAGAKNAASWASTGAQVAGPWGAAIGGAAGIASGFFAARKANKDMIDTTRDQMEAYSDRKSAMNENLSGKLNARAAAENGDYFTNRYTNMEKGGEIGVHPTIAQTMGYLKSQKQVQKMQAGSKVEMKEKSKGKSIHMKPNEIQPGGAALRNENWFYEDMSDEGTGTAYRFEEGYELTDTDELTGEEQLERLRSNNFRDSFTDDRKNFLVNYIKGNTSDRYQVKDNGDVILKDKNIYLGNTNSIQKLDYRKAPWSEEEGQDLYQIRNPRTWKSTQERVTSRKQGGSIEVDSELTKITDHIKRVKAKKNDEKKLRSGGSLNMIAKGVSHEEDNNIGDRGIPIISNKNRKKLAEIEVNELTLNSKTATKVEELIAEYKKTEDPAILKELGKYVKVELTENTADNQGELIK